MGRRRKDPLDGDLAGALRTVKGVFGGEAVTVVSVIPNDSRPVPEQVAGYVQATLLPDEEDGEAA